MEENKKENAVKKFWDANKVKILGTTTALSIGAVAIMRVGIKQHNDFLKEHGLYEAFYALDEE